MQLWKSPNWNEVKRIRGDIDMLWKQYEMYWGKMSRIKWLTFGDKNTKKVHASTVQRGDRNKLYRLMDKNVVWVEGKLKDMVAIEDFFKANV